MSDAPTAWMIRAGRRGENEDAVLEKGLAGVRFGEAPDLTEAASRDAVKQLIHAADPGAGHATIANHAGQLWKLRSRIKPGDLVVLPLKSKSQIALGIVSGGYRYRADADHDLRHCIAVDWKRTDVPRTALRQDLLYSLGASMTVCQIKRNDAARRLQRVLETGEDPGPPFAGVESADAGDADEADSPESTFDIERLGRDQIQAHLTENFAGHRLADLVAAVLDAEGFYTQVAPPGPDGGIDVFAGSGPLGLDSPKLVVQVKSGLSPSDVKIVRELQGVLGTHGADQGLLVAWGGVTKAARRELRSQFFRVRLWDADDLLDAILRNYDRLDEEYRIDLPLKRIWSLASDPVE